MAPEILESQKRLLDRGNVNTAISVLTKLGNQIDVSDDYHQRAMRLYLKSITGSEDLTQVNIDNAKGKALKAVLSNIEFAIKGHREGVVTAMTQSSAQRLDLQASVTSTSETSVVGSVYQVGGTYSQPGQNRGSSGTNSRRGGGKRSTSRKTSRTTSSDDGIKMRTAEDQNTYELDVTIGGKISFDKMKGYVNHKSFSDMMKNMDGADLSMLYGQVLQDGELRKNSKGIITYHPLNTGNISKIFKRYGYSWKNSFWDGMEAGCLTVMVKNIYSTQEKIRSGKLSFKDKMGIIFDYNRDGFLTNDLHFVTREYQTFKNAASQQRLNNLLSNLFGDPNVFWNEFNNGNYIKAKEMLNTALGAQYSNKSADRYSPLPPLSIDDQFHDPKALERYGNLQEGIRNEVSRQVENDPKYKNLDPETKKNIKFVAATAVLGASNGAGLTFDISGATKGILDTATIGWLNGMPGIALQKNIIKDKNGRYSVGVGVANFIPFASATVRLFETQKGLKGFPAPTHFDGNSVTLAAGITLAGGFVGVGVERLGSKNKAGIEKAKARMGKFLDGALGEMEKGKTFEQSRYPGKKLGDKMYYDSLLNAIRTKAYTVEQIKEGALRNYEASLYKDASGLHLSSFGIGLAFAHGFIYPTVGIGFEYRKDDGTWKQRGENDVYRMYSSQEGTSERLRVTFDEPTETLIAELMKFENAFSWRTRYNAGATEFLDPNLDINARWNGLLTMSRRTKALRDAGLNKFLTSRNFSEDQKFTIISTLAPYTRKSKEGDLSTVGYEKVSQRDFERRIDNFSRVAGINLEQAAKDYDTYLRSGKIGSTNQPGLAFDIVSTRNVGGKKRVSGIDMLYTNINFLTVNGKIYCQEIKDPNVINVFRQGYLPRVPEPLKGKLEEAIRNGTFKLMFAKTGNGFDDLIVPWIEVPGQEPTKTDHGYYIPPETYYFNLLGSVKVQHGKDEQPGDGTTTDPDRVDNTITNPGEGQGGSGVGIDITGNTGVTGSTRVISTGNGIGVNVAGGRGQGQIVPGTR